MKIATMLAYSPYGAFELKRCYQKNMLCGLLISGCVALSVILIFAILYRPAALTAGGSEKVESTEYTKLPPPVPMGQNAEQNTKIKVDPDFSKLFSTADLTPVEDDDVIQMKVLPTGIQKTELVFAERGSGGNETGGYSVYQPGEIQGIIIPEPDVFVARDEEPILLENCLPEYPEMARKVGLEGRVRMQVYVGTDGLVKRAQVIKAEPEGAGFAEAALAAAWKLKYRPAMQNQNPVGVWVAYKVDFKIK